MLLDLVLVNPNIRILGPYSAIEPPLWLGLIATHYRKQGMQVAVVDAEAEDWTVERTIQETRKLNPRKVVIVAM